MKGRATVTLMTRLVEGFCKQNLSMYVCGFSAQVSSSVARTTVQPSLEDTGMKRYILTYTVRV